MDIPERPEGWKPKEAPEFVRFYMGMLMPVLLSYLVGINLDCMCTVGMDIWVWVQI